MKKGRNLQYGYGFDGYQSSIRRIEFASSLISPTFSSVISRMSVQDRRFLKVSSSLVPLVNKSPRNTELYKLMMSNVKC